MTSKLQIRNSTTEFLIFTRQAGEDGIEVRVADETVWLTQKLIGVLFDKGRSTITEHLRNVFGSGALEELSVCRDFRHTAEDGKTYTTRFYNLDAIIAVGFRVNSARATQFRQWMGLTSWKNAPRGKIIKPDVVVAKNYLTEKELRALDRIVTMYLDYAEDQAERRMPMTMEDWATKRNAFLKFNERDILDHPGKVSQEVAKAFAESEFEKYRIMQDRLFESDFDRHIQQALAPANKPAKRRPKPKSK